MNLPTGTVTFLFTEIEGAARLWERHPDSMRRALTLHDSLMREAIDASGGALFKTVGDAFCAAFNAAPDALQAAIAAQSALLSAHWPGETEIRVRMALHTGAAEVRDADYFGRTLNRVARMLGAAHGSQILLSGITRSISLDSLPHGSSLRSLGEHRLKDLGSPEPIFQLCHPDLPAHFPSLRSMESVPNNLPLQITSFIGRDAELQAVTRLFEKSRLVTLTGSGGCGKTRLALQAAADMLDRMEDGVWLVELAAITDPGLVPRTMADTLGLKEEAGRSVLQTLTDYLKSRKALIVLDNCEHLLDACARLADTILRTCPRVVLLATSREGMGIAGETAYRVPSLSLPEPGLPQSSSSLSRYGAVQLFIDRATLVQPEFRVTNANALALASVCNRLDGIPLAIELAAARVRSLSVEQVNQKLDQRFRLLTGGSRTALPRQQTLRSLIDWSYDLLNESEKALFQRLAVFSGGWTLETAENVCAGEGVEEWEVLDLLTSLTDKSLVIAEERDVSARFRVLETVRQYARDRLMESGDGEQWRDRHLVHYLGLAEEAAEHLSGADQQAWLARLETEHDNLRAATEYALNHAEGPRSALRFVASLSKFWMVRACLSEGREISSGALAISDLVSPDTNVARVLHAAGNLAYVQGDYVEARSRFEQAAIMWAALGNRVREAGSRINLATICQTEGQKDLARAQFEQSLAIFEELGDNHGTSVALGCLGTVSKEQGDNAAALGYLKRAVALNREMGNRSAEANSLNNLGVIHRSMGDEDSARQFFESALEIDRELGYDWEAGLCLINLSSPARNSGDYPLAWSMLAESIQKLKAVGARRDMVSWLEEVAHLEALLGRSERAVRIFGAAAAHRELMRFPSAAADESETASTLGKLRNALGSNVFEEALASGMQMALEDAVEYAIEGAVRQV